MTSATYIRAFGLILFIHTFTVSALIVSKIFCLRIIRVKKGCSKGICRCINNVNSSPPKIGASGRRKMGDPPQPYSDMSLVLIATTKTINMNIPLATDVISLNELRLSSIFHGRIEMTWNGKEWLNSWIIQRQGLIRGGVTGGTCPPARCSVTNLMPFVVRCKL